MGSVRFYVLLVGAFMFLMSCIVLYLTRNDDDEDETAGVGLLGLSLMIIAWVSYPYLIDLTNWASKVLGE